MKLTANELGAFKNAPEEEVARFVAAATADATCRARGAGRPFCGRPATHYRVRLYGRTLTEPDPWIGSIPVCAECANGSWKNSEVFMASEIIAAAEAALKK